MFVVRLKLQAISDKSISHVVYFDGVPSPSRITEELESHVKSLDEPLRDKYLEAWGDLRQLNWNALAAISDGVGQGWAVSAFVYAEVEMIDVRPANHLYDLSSSRCIP